MYISLAQTIKQRLNQITLENIKTKIKRKTNNSFKLMNSINKQQQQKKIDEAKMKSWGRRRKIKAQRKKNDNNK